MKMTGYPKDWKMKKGPSLPSGASRNYCEKHRRRHFNIGGRMRCPDCHKLRVERRREKEQASAT